MTTQEALALLGVHGWKPVTRDPHEAMKELQAELQVGEVEHPAIMVRAQELAVLFNRQPVAIFVTRKDGTITFASRYATEGLGWKRSQVVGSRVDEFTVTPPVAGRVNWMMPDGGHKELVWMESQCLAEMCLILAFPADTKGARDGQR